MSRQRRRHSMVRGYEIGERPAVAMPSRTTHAGAHPFRARSLSVSRGRPHALSVPRTGAAHSIEKREPGARPFGPHVQFECVTAFSSDCSAARGRKPSWLMTSIGRVGGWRGGGRRGISVSAPFGSRCPTSHAVAPFPVAAHRTGRADFPHPALGQGFTPSPTARHAPSARGVRDPWSRRDRRGGIVPISAAPYLVLVAQPPAQPRHGVAVDRPIRFIDGTYLKVVRPAAQRAIQLAHQQRGLLPYHRFGGQRMNRFDHALDALLRRPVSLDVAGRSSASTSAQTCSPGLNSRSGTVQIRVFSSLTVSFSLPMSSRIRCRASSALPFLHRITRSSA